MFPNLDAEQKRRRERNVDTAQLLNITRVTFESKKRSGRFTVTEAAKLCKHYNANFHYLFSTDTDAIARQ